MASEAELPQNGGRAVPAALAALVAPESGMERQARIGTARLAFIIAMACALLAAFAEAVRIDSSAATLQKLEKAGSLQQMSERQIEDETRNANRLFQVARVGKGVFEAPLQLGMGSLAVLGLVWFLRGKVKGRAVVPVAAAVLLPGAIANLLDALSAFNQASLPPQGAALAPRNISAIAAALGHPIAAPWVKLGSAFDFFSLWAALMMAFGVAAAGEVPARRALTVTLIGWVLWRLLVNVGMGG